MADLTIHRFQDNRLDELVSLWTAAFPSDPREYAYDFLANLPSDAVTLIGECNHTVVTMLLLLPARAVFGEKSYPVRYLYAGCTHPNYRGHGYYHQLMRAAVRVVEEMGEFAIFLHPADDALTSTYKRMGYRSGICGSPRNLEDRRAMACDDIDNYMRQRALIGRGIAEKTLFWEMSNDVTRRFITDAVAGGAEMATGDTFVQLKYENRIIESLCRDAVCENDDFCLWIPIGETPLITLMENYKGFTGLVGD